jgi:hypothetical protein
MRVNSLPPTIRVCSHLTCRRASKYVKLTKPSQCVDVFVNPADTVWPEWYFLLLCQWLSRT